MNEKYTITEDGNVINNKTNRILKPDINNKGYQRVSIYGRREFIHRLVAKQYIPNPNSYPQVNHKDGNKLNNHKDNLEWMTNDMNQQHAIDNGLIIKAFIKGENHCNAKLTQENVINIRNMYPTCSVQYIATLFNVSKITIYKILSKELWSHI